ncbi:MAG TPA: GatB/YqeY domain-containing protein, partial [Anaerolineales bacterium]|nr:GatB/YqeY domain-containing protein [Anaerolineales bacterium]
AAVKQVEVDKRIELDDNAVLNLLQKEVKNRREAIEEAKKANRSDLIEANEAEINVLQVFLPKAMPAEELRAIVEATIAETGAASPADMGKVMKAVMPKVAGKAPNDMVSAAVRELLQK